MKRAIPFVLFSFLFIGSKVQCQTYISGSFSYYNGTGTFKEKGMATLEVGRTVDAISLGAAVGTTSFSNGDTYVEFRPSVTVFSRSRVSVIGTLGAGYVFESDENFLTEYCGTINYSLCSSWSIGVFAGGYKFDGKATSSKYTFVGTGLTYSFLKSKK